MKKKISLSLILFCLTFLYFMLNAENVVIASDRQFNSLSYQTKNYTFEGIGFDVQSSWNWTESDDKKTIYFHPKDGLVMLQYNSGLTIEDETSREVLKESIASSGALIENEKTVLNEHIHNDGYIYDFEQTIDDELYEGEFLMFDHNDGFMSIVFVTSATSPEDYKDEFSVILSSMGFEIGERATGLTVNSEYNNAYTVSFHDYEIYYLTNEDESTISIFTSDNPSDVYVSPYTGDFNNGANFDWNGLKMRAHYKYWDQDSKLIVYDESGNENEATNAALSVIEGYMNKHN